jgi:alpha-glucosidase (family GH31 glycosyl hydrolase)
MRAMWLHYPSEHEAVARGDQYMWGRDMLIAPVVEKGATTRALYLPRGAWYDFWTNERLAGGREVTRPVDLATTPIFVRAGAVIPTGPVKQYVDEPSEEPLTLTVYPGADGRSSMYDDDGTSFDYRRGAYMRMLMTWRDATKRLTLSLTPGSRMVPTAQRRINVRVAGSSITKPVVFSGRSIDVQL